MKSVTELSELYLRQAQLEQAMRKPGGARVIEERELLAVKERIANFPPAAAVGSNMTMGVSTTKRHAPADY